MTGESITPPTYNPDDPDTSWTQESTLDPDAPTPGTEPDARPDAEPWTDPDPEDPDVADQDRDG